MLTSLSALPVTCCTISRRAILFLSLLNLQSRYLSSSLGYIKSHYYYVNRTFMRSGQWALFSAHHLQLIIKVAAPTVFCTCSETSASMSSPTILHAWANRSPIEVPSSPVKSSPITSPGALLAAIPAKLSTLGHWRQPQPPPYLPVASCHMHT